MDLSESLWRIYKQHISRIRCPNELNDSIPQLTTHARKRSSDSIKKLFTCCIKIAVCIFFQSDEWNSSLPGEALFSGSTNSDEKRVTSLLSDHSSDSGGMLDGIQEKHQIHFLTSTHVIVIQILCETTKKSHRKAIADIATRIWTSSLLVTTSDYFHRPRSV